MKCGTRCGLHFVSIRAALRYEDNELSVIITFTWNALSSASLATCSFQMFPDSLHISAPPFPAAPLVVSRVWAQHNSRNSNGSLTPGFVTTSRSKLLTRNDSYDILIIYDSLRQMRSQRFTGKLLQRGAVRCCSGTLPLVHPPALCTSNR